MKKLKILTPPLIEQSKERCQFCKSNLTKTRKAKILFSFRIPFTLIDFYSIIYSRTFKFFCNNCNYYKPQQQSFFHKHKN